VSLALPLAADDSVIRTLFWLGVLLLPVIGRALRALREKGEKGEKGERAGGTGVERDASRREAQRRREEEGGELWRRLARGELPEAPAAPVTEARRVEAPRRRPVGMPARPVIFAERANAEDLEAPRPLSVLGEVSEQREAGEVSLEAASPETEAQPLPLDSLAAKPAALMPAPARRSRLIASRADLRRAVVMSEILALPVSLRVPETR